MAGWEPPCDFFGKSCSMGRVLAGNLTRSGPTSYSLSAYTLSGLTERGLVFGTERVVLSHEIEPELESSRREARSSQPSFRRDDHADT